ncbi:unnamed protein product [Trifolium pratense]|uniref:Uncharacterized protein n=1 Tax=Trifolium pratense TaxID=57577 RepID=A0ACB0KYZ7_TRIPR|nr:unnamed protein product [Trifolium pratense]
MIGPSPYVLINMGARYTPCMHAVDGLQTRMSGGEVNWPCPNTTSIDVANCQLNNLCGFNMPSTQNPIYPGQNIPLNEFSNQPDQWFRFIIPIFLHAGIIHIGFNMLLQMTLGKEMEFAIGSIRFFLVYMCSGIFGFVLGGNFAASGIASTGASGALFGILALNLLDLFYTWGERKSPFKDLTYIMLDIIISFVLGLLPGLDNFSHIGGFFMGLALGICILHSPNALRKRINQELLPYTPVSQTKSSFNDRPNFSLASFIRNPIEFFRGRRVACYFDRTKVSVRLLKRHGGCGKTSTILSPTPATRLDWTAQDFVDFLIENSKILLCEKLRTPNSKELLCYPKNLSGTFGNDL